MDLDDIINFLNSLNSGDAQNKISAKFCNIYDLQTPEFKEFKKFIIYRQRKDNKDVAYQPNSTNEVEKDQKSVDSTSIGFTDILSDQTLVTFDELWDKNRISTKDLDKATK